MYPAFLVENVYSDVQFPAHLVSASSAMAGHEAWRIATGRRSLQDHWTPSTTNTEDWLKVDCGAARAVSMLALDRGHNLAGKRVILEKSGNDFAKDANGAFTDTQTVLDVILPAAAAEGSSLEDANGATTEESAWVRRFAEASARYWRIRIPALGAGLAPKIVGAWLGKAWSLTYFLDQPWEDDGLLLQAREFESDAGWRGSSRLARIRTGVLRLKLGSYGEYESAARYHIVQQFWKRRPMWIVHDDARAERAVLALPRLGPAALGYREGWAYRQGDLEWIEHEPTR